MKSTLRIFLLSLLAIATATAARTDVLVYGATPAGVCAAIGAAREGMSVALSVTHVAYCSIRVEPTWMTIGQSAGVAAALAAKGNTSVQQLDYAKLRARLLAQKQTLDLP